MEREWRDVDAGLARRGPAQRDPRTRRYVVHDFRLERPGIARAPLPRSTQRLSRWAALTGRRESPAANACSNSTVCSSVGPDLALEEFSRHWRTVHRELALRLVAPGIMRGYVQNHRRDVDLPCAAKPRSTTVARKSGSSAWSRWTRWPRRRSTSRVRDPTRPISWIRRREVLHRGSLDSVCGSRGAAAGEWKVLMFYENDVDGWRGVESLDGPGRLPTSARCGSSATVSWPRRAAVITRRSSRAGGAICGSFSEVRGKTPASPAFRQRAIAPATLLPMTELDRRSAATGRRRGAAGLEVPRARRRLEISLASSPRQSPMSLAAAERLQVQHRVGAGSKYQRPPRLTYSSK